MCFFKKKSQKKKVINCLITYAFTSLVTVKYTPQYIWLEAELKKVDRKKTPWLIVIMHTPIYNSNSAHYMEGESMRAAFESWFVKYKVDVVFAGHVHAYERSVCHHPLYLVFFLYS
ncbi:putative Acid phosphatase [Helianthus annuus]|nr:putative Acid phosphatase [Helianthus annuus]KAJ0673663.1 putative Acid phosphatase [Helianthus annuus]KAJ0677021.1 putative Acid phosphatase [Helianthus annuus]